ncbi:molybdopterin-dependent oxidoreductase [Chloroflexota bacterium]
MKEVIHTTCSSHCGSVCPLKVHVEEGVITHIETDDGEEPQCRACLRGRAYRQRVYAPDRLLYPLKRIGERGEGKVKRISWDEALDTVAHELTRIRNTYGSASIMHKASMGDITCLHGWKPVERLLNLSGGYSALWGSYSVPAGVFTETVTFGTRDTVNSREDLLNSRLIIMWGWNPAVTILYCNTSWYLAQAKERGTRIVAVDPRYNESVATFTQQWIPIRPGTDSAMLIAMAYVIINEGLQNQKFLDRYTEGFDKFKDYVLGEEDGIPKTPAWAEVITSVPAETIVRLAREYATTKPAALIAGFAPGRTAYGEQYHRAAITIAAMTGNIGIPGGASGGKSFTGIGQGLLYKKMKRGMTSPPNPVECAASDREGALKQSYEGFMVSGSVHLSKMADAILRGRSGGYPADYKSLVLVNTNYPNQYLNLNKAVSALKSLEFMVVLEQFMTPAAKFADIILPTTTFLERNDLTAGETFYGAQVKVIEPQGECKSHLEICCLLANRMGLENFGSDSEDYWLKQSIEGSEAEKYIPSLEALKKEGIKKVTLAKPYVAFTEQIEDPEHHPFPTPSGKIEIYSKRLAQMRNSLLPPIPKYIETWESVNDPLATRYPLQLITSHFKRRAHSQFDNIPWLRELEPQALWISRRDAETRGIRDEEMVQVFNDRGKVVVPAKVTERIMPGVVDLPQGAWYDPDRDGVDRGGCCNVLSNDEYSPGEAYITNTMLVQVAKV